MQSRELSHICAKTRFLLPQGTWRCTDLVPAWLLLATPVVVDHIFLSLACCVEGHWKEIFGSRGRSDLGLVLSVFCRLLCSSTRTHVLLALSLIHI